MLSELRTLPKARVEEINALLRKKERVAVDDPDTDLLDSVSVEFPDGWIADIRVLNSDTGPYLDPILWDDCGNERACLDSGDTQEFSPRHYIFDGSDFEAHEVIVLRENA
ncbi:hypothetical protein LCGC14_0858450 [marine sediment metagenome]|uniref:Uncharacterized protein n=1 Tax=marine sediment metagenome TaxID=412755 RepID=A0A0F9SF72_9ZZZZ